MKRKKIRNEGQKTQVIQRLILTIKRIMILNSFSGGGGVLALRADGSMPLGFLKATIRGLWSPRN